MNDLELTPEHEAFIEKILSAVRIMMQAKFMLQLPQNKLTWALLRTQIEIIEDEVAKWEQELPKLLDEDMYSTALRLQTDLITCSTLLKFELPKYEDTPVPSTEKDGKKDPNTH